MEVIASWVSYADRLEQRALSQIDTLVIHCTELPDLDEARAYAERILYPESATGACGHYYIDRDGGTFQWVPIERVAHHVVENNAHTVGIELVNTGRFPDWLDTRNQRFEEPYPEAQISACLALAEQLRDRLPSLQCVAAHADLDRRMVQASDDPNRKVRRKLDPGPLFPWDEFLRHSGLVRTALAR